MYDDYCPTGKYILIASDYRQPTVLDAHTRKQAFVLQGDGEKIYGTAFATDESSLITRNWNNTASLWAVPSGQLN
jgi:hypothetical protein